MQDPDCLFCKIVNGEIPSNKVFEDNQLYAFHDINPVGPVHILIVPKDHIPDNNELTSEHQMIAGRLLTSVPEIASKLGIADDGYRLIMNTGPHGHQEVKHLHLHVIGGAPMKNPMG